MDYYLYVSIVENGFCLWLKIADFGLLKDTFFINLSEIEFNVKTICVKPVLSTV